MDTFDDLEDMAPIHLDATTTERLITGRVEIDDAPPGFDRIARLINTAQGPATAEELEARAATVAAFAARVRSRPVVRTKTKRTLALLKFPAKVLALAAPVVVLGGSVAVATGSLPPSAQAAASRALSTLGISVPKPQNDNHAIAGSPPSNTGGAVATGTDADVDPRSRTTLGLCRAWRVGGLHDYSSAYRHLVAAAGGAGNLATYCAGVPASSTSDGATDHAEKPSSGQLDGGHGVTKASTTRRPKAVAHASRSMPKAIAIRPLTQPAATGRRSSEASGTSRLPAGTSGPPVAASGQVPRRTHKAITAVARRHGQRPSTKANHGVPSASKSPPHEKAGPTPPVSASPVSSSIPTSRGRTKHYGRTGRPRRLRECTVSARPGHVIPVHRHCHPVTPTGSTSDTSPG